MHTVYSLDCRETDLDFSMQRVRDEKQYIYDVTELQYVVKRAFEEGFKIIILSRIIQNQSDFKVNYVPGPNTGHV